MTTKTLAYNFIQIKELGNIWIPEAIVCSTEDNKLQYYLKKASPDILISYGIEPKEQQELLDICTRVSIISLEKKYCSHLKKKTSLFKIAEDKNTLLLIQQYLHQQLAPFFLQITLHKYPICSFIKKNAFIENHRICYSDKEIKPLFFFNKTTEGVDYSLKLQGNNTDLLPKNYEIKILLDKEGWFTMDGVLYKLLNVNANKLTPFLTKETLFINKKIELLFFTKFVLGMSENSDIITNGFEVITQNKIDHCSLHIYHDFLSDSYKIQPKFNYGSIKINYADKNPIITKLTTEDDEIGILKISRDKTLENEFISILENSGLTENYQKHLELKEESDYSILELLANSKDAYLNNNIHIATFEIDNKEVSFQLSDTKFTVSEKSDWFDFDAMVTHGDFSFKFSDLKNNIANNNPLFLLPNNHYFIIPKEWLFRYKEFFLFANIKKDGIQIKKSNYTIIKNLGLSKTVEKNLVNHADYNLPSSLKATLRPYQKHGVDWLLNHYNNNFGACLADDMGLGKTLQTIAVLTYAKEKLKAAPTEKRTIHLDLFSDLETEIKPSLGALIVVPASLIFNWRNEIHKFAPHLKQISYKGKDRDQQQHLLSSYDVVITTYQTALRDIPFLKTQHFSFLVLDEAQNIKNNQSKVSKAINEIAASHKITLSGTPIENSLLDLWSQMHFLNEGVLGSYTFFKKHYQVPIEQENNVERAQKLRTLIAPYILRRTKEQVAPDLPELSTQIVYVEMEETQRSLYEKEKSAVRNTYLKITTPKPNFSVLQSLQNLRLMANHPVLCKEHGEEGSGKFKAVTAYLETLITAGKKALVFSSFVSHLKLYEEWSKQQNHTYTVLTGETSSIEREKRVNQFQNNDNLSLFFISLKAGGTGLNLTAASYVIILDPWWNPFAEKQAIARAHRIGQKVPVHTVRFISKDSIEEKIMVLQEKKKGYADNIIEARENTESTLQELEFLLS